MSLIGPALPSIRSIINDLVNDPSLSRQITYKRYTGETAFDDAKGRPEPQYDAISLNAASLKHTERSISATGLEGQVQAGDHVYMIDYETLVTANLEESDFTNKDIIVDGEDRKIKNITWILDLCATVTVIG